MLSDVTVLNDVRCTDTDPTDPKNYIPNSNRQIPTIEHQTTDNRQPMPNTDHFKLSLSLSTRVVE